MSTVLKKADADKIAFLHNPRAIRVETSDVASKFVKQQAEKSSGFQIADVVAQQSGIQELKRLQLEAQVEDIVLERLKEIQEKAYQQAYELGAIEGSEKAYKDTTDNINAKLAIFDENIKLMENLIQEIAKQYETTFIKLIYQLAKAIALREIKIEQEPLVGALVQLTSGIHAAENIVVKMNPKDLQFIEEARKRSGRNAEALEKLKLQPDESLQSGGCLIETNYGVIDASVGQRVEKAWQALEAKLPLIKPG